MKVPISVLILVLIIFFGSFVALQSQIAPFFFVVSFSRVMKPIPDFSLDVGRYLRARDPSANHKNQSAKVFYGFDAI